jgi:predicted MFS family arabinose efflux permease
MNWPVLVAAMVCLFFAFSAPSFSLPFLFRSVIEEFGWTREQATLLASAKYATGAVVSIVVGRFIDTTGVRKALIIVSTLGAIAMVSFLWVPNLTFYYMSGILLGVAGPGTIVAVKVLISRVFHASQGTAMGVAMMSAAVGAIVVPIVIRVLIDAFGWRMAIALMSLGVWFIALPMLIFYLNDKSFESSDTDADAPGAKPVVLHWGPVFELMKQWRFWLVGFAVLIAGAVDQAVQQHSVLYLEVDLEMDKNFVAGGIALIGAVGIGARVLVGGIFDKWSARGVSFCYLLLAAGCIVALGALSPVLFGAFVVFRAVGHAAVLLDTTVLGKHVFGLANIGVLLGVYTAFVNIGFAIGPWAMARMYDTSGSYDSAFILGAVLSVFAAAILLPVRPDYWLEMKARFARQGMQKAT